MVIRMSAGDLNAWVALIGFILGVSTGAFALKKGFSLGRAHETQKSSGVVMPAIMVGILLLAVCTTLLKSSTSGPGSMHAPIIISLIGGLIFGAFAQKSRMCFAGSIRDVVLMKNFRSADSDHRFHLLLCLSIMWLQEILYLHLIHRESWLIQSISGIFWECMR